MNNFDVVNLGVENGTEIFVAQCAGESLDLVKIGSELVVNNFDVNLGVENGTENFGAQYADESLDLVKIDSELLVNNLDVILGVENGTENFGAQMCENRSIWSKLAVYWS